MGRTDVPPSVDDVLIARFTVSLSKPFVPTPSGSKGGWPSHLLQAHQRLEAVMGRKLGIDMPQMPFQGTWHDDQCLGDLIVRASKTADCSTISRSRAVNVPIPPQKIVDIGGTLLEAIGSGRHPASGTVPRDAAHRQADGHCVSATRRLGLLFRSGDCPIARSSGKKSLSLRPQKVRM